MKQPLTPQNSNAVPSRVEFERILSTPEFLDVAWNLGEEVQVRQPRGIKSRLKNWWIGLKKNFFSGLSDLVLSLPSLAILPVLISVPYVSATVAPVVVFCCPVLVVSSALISVMRVRTIATEMASILTLGQLPPQSSSSMQQFSVDRGEVIFHPTIWQFLRSDLIRSWVCAAIEIIGLFLFGIQLLNYLDLLWAGYLIFFMFPIVDAFRGLYDARMLDKIPSVCAFNKIALLPTYRPLRYDTATGRFEASKTAVAITFNGICGLKLGIQRLNDPDGSLLHPFPFVTHIIFRMAGGATPAGPRHGQDTAELDASKLVCFRVLPLHTDRDRVVQVYEVAVTIQHTVELLRAIKPTLKADLGGAVDAIDMYLVAVSQVQDEFDPPRDVSWVTAALDRSWAIQNSARAL